jgi:hypothetical protein
MQSCETSGTEQDAWVHAWVQMCLRADRPPPAPLPLWDIASLARHLPVLTTVQARSMTGVWRMHSMDAHLRLDGSLLDEVLLEVGQADGGAAGPQHVAIDAGALSSSAGSYQLIIPNVDARTGGHSGLSAGCACKLRIPADRACTSHSGATSPLPGEPASHHAPVHFDLPPAAAGMFVGYRTTRNSTSSEIAGASQQGHAFLDINRVVGTAQALPDGALSWQVHSATTYDRPAGGYCALQLL